jgi:hypothetical protein
MADNFKKLSPYEPLMTETSFRVFELLPGSEADAITGKLRAVDWDDFPQYEAISYAWGDPTQKVPVIVDGARVDITVNLETGLKHLRYEDRSRVLWVDAIWQVPRRLLRCFTYRIC